jgi:hypothetical protein
MDTDIVLNYICLILFKKIFSCSKNDMYVYFRTEGIVPYSRWRLYRDAYVWVLIMIITRLQQPMLSIPKKKNCVLLERLNLFDLGWIVPIIPFFYWILEIR